MQHKWLIRTFVISVLVTCLVAFIKGAVAWNASNDASFISYHDLSSFVHMHAVILAIQVAMAGVLVLFPSLEAVKSGYVFNRGVDLSIGALLTVFMLLLSARMPLFVYLLLVLVAVGRLFIQRGQVVKGLLLITALVAIVGAGWISTPVNRERFMEVVSTDEEYGADYWGGRNLRIMIWDCSATIIKRNWLLGSGVANVQQKLNECYKEKGHHPLLILKATFNAHNQFLQTWLATGIFGFLVLLGWLSTIFWFSWRYRNYYLLAMVVLFIFTSLTESVLSVQKSIVFLLCFKYFLLFASHKDSNTANK